MIFGSEGLPGSGKSLEAMQHVVDSLTAGRTVVTNIHGIVRPKLAEFLAMPLPTLERLLITLEPPSDLDEDQITAWTKTQFLANSHADSLWIWDEINQFWPPDRQPLSADWAKFVTEHRHLGIDILIMGQDLTELHQTWRKRLQRYTRYTKLDMMGKEESFHWASFTNIGRNRFKRTADGKKPYNKKFYGLYLSHRAETENKGNYKDKRFGVFQTKHKFYAVLFFLALALAGKTLVGFFHHDAPTSVAPEPAHQVVQPQKIQAVTSETAIAGTQPRQDPQPSTVKPDVPAKEPLDYFDKFASKFDLRLAAYLERVPAEGDTRPWFDFEIDVLDGNYHVKERFNRASIVALGWAIKKTDFGIELSKGDQIYVVRSWPLDNYGNVPQKVVADIKPRA